MINDENKISMPAGAGTEPANAVSTDTAPTSDASAGAPLDQPNPEDAEDLNKDLIPPVVEERPPVPPAPEQGSEAEKLKSDNKEFGTSDIPLADRYDEVKANLVDAQKELEGTKEELGLANDEIGRLKSDLAYMARSVPANSRTLNEGTQLVLGNVVVTLAAPAAVTYEGHESEQKFVGMLLESIDANANFDANKRNLALVYSRATGGPVRFEDQSDKALGLLLEDTSENGHFRRILGVTHEDVVAEIARRREPASE